MQTHITTRRRNRVYKSLHKPLTYLGVERTLFYFVCVGAVGVFNLFNSLLAGVGHQRPPGPTQLPLWLCLHLPRQSRCHAIHRRHDQARPTTQRRCL